MAHRKLHKTHPRSPTSPAAPFHTDERVRKNRGGVCHRIARIRPKDDELRTVCGIVLAPGALGWHARPEPAQRPRVAVSDCKSCERMREAVNAIAPAWKVTSPAMRERDRRQLEARGDIAPAKPTKARKTAAERVPAGATLRRQRVSCGKRCSRCPNHGPYWYAAWKDKGRVRTAYIGSDEKLGEFLRTRSSVVDIDDAGDGEAFGEAVRVAARSLAKHRGDRVIDLRAKPSAVDDDDDAWQAMQRGAFSRRGGAKGGDPSRSARARARSSR